jgi:DNA repair protein RadC
MKIRKCNIIYEDNNIDIEAKPVSLYPGKIDKKSLSYLYNLVKRIVDINSVTEFLLVIVLDDNNTPTAYTVMGFSDEETVSFSISAILRFVLLSGYTDFILIHNHNNGYKSFSTEDKKSARDIKKAAKIVGLSLVNEFIVVDDTIIPLWRGK